MSLTTGKFRTLLRRYRWAWPAAILLLMALGAIFAPWIAPQNPWDLAEIELANGNLPPAWARTDPAPIGDSTFLLGTDEQGRDIFSAVLYGLRVSLFVGVTATAISLAVGVLCGLYAGYWGGLFDAFTMRLADIQLAFPSILIALFLMAVWGPGLDKIIFAVAIVHWVVYARVARGVTLAEREKDYVSAVRSLGAATPRIVFGHILPNIASPLLVISAVQFASVVILEATLSYLGLGVPLTRPSLGMLIQFGYDSFFSGRWWVGFFPGLALVVLVVAVNWLADILRVNLAPEGS